MSLPFLNRALAVGSRASSRLAGGRVVVQRGDERISLDATFGRAQELVDDGEGGTFLIARSDRDFILPANQYVFSGAICQPETGDRFTVVCDGSIYEVLPLDGKNCWRECDPRGSLMRVYTKKVSV
jgi:hypothetical protein